MSQDNQNQQPPSSPEPKESQSQQRIEQVTQPSKRVQPVWKSFIIGILRGTIGILEATVDKIETESPVGAVDTRGGASLQGWGVVLGKIRSFLPENLSTKFSDTALTGIIAGIAVVTFWITSSVLSGKPTEVATVPPTQEAPPTTITTPPVAEEVPLPQIEETPTPQAEETPPSVAEEETLPQIEETPTPQAEETLPPVTGEVPPQVEESPLPEPTPTPTPEIILTPEQTLIAAIENQVAEISDRFASGLIQSIQANFRSSNLIIKISNEWYNLKQSQQDKLAADILQRSKDLDFSHLEIIDSQGRLVARNPVVGTEMIIFQRQARNT
ncbi:hypothetical protein [Scytonema sp. NUACC26]|uniref:hypothetical protein n=1 Tax=Scytonema sp. NUACC26 TaxID=3140176 RepID=UPI0034DB9908